MVSFVHTSADLGDYENDNRPGLFAARLSVSFTVRFPEALPARSEVTAGYTITDFRKKVQRQRVCFGVNAKKNNL